MSRRVGVISIGTNSTRVLLADMASETPHVDLARSVGTRLGEGLGASGHIGAEPMRRTLDAVRSHVRAIRGHYVKLHAIATSAVRRADNGDEFAHLVADIVGVPLRVLSGDEEAEASYRGAITSLGSVHGERVGVIDSGGGSTEYAVGDAAHPERTVSCEIGAVRLTDALPALSGRDGSCDLSTIDAARERAREALAPIRDFPESHKLAFVGGSATTAAAVIRGKTARMERCDVTRGDLQRALLRLCSLDLESRKNVTGIKPQRADILPAGIIILDTVLELTNTSHAIATTSDLLLGYLLQQRDAHPVATHGARRG